MLWRKFNWNTLYRMRVTRPIPLNWSFRYRRPRAIRVSMGIASLSTAHQQRWFAQFPMNTRRWWKGWDKWRYQIVDMLMIHPFSFSRFPKPLTSRLISLDSPSTNLSSMQRSKLKVWTSRVGRISLFTRSPFTMTAYWMSWGRRSRITSFWIHRNKLSIPLW